MMNWYMIYITVGLFGPTIFQETLISEFFGDITPSTSKIVLNGTLELNCTINAGMNISSLYWETPEGKAPLKNTLIIGNNTLQLRKYVTNVSEEGTYLCRSTSEKQMSRTPRTNVVVEYEAIRNVTNFTCMVDKDKDELQCRWKLGTYNHEEYLSIMASVSFDYGVHFIDCPEKLPQESCTWSQGDGDIYAITIFINLTITNTEFKFTKSFFYDFRNQKILRLSPPTDVTSRVTSSCTCVNLTWSTGERFIVTETKIYLNSKWNATPGVNEIDRFKTAMICGLIPDSAYELDLQQKPTGGIYFSDLTTAKFNTCMTAPTNGPGLSSSGYLSAKCDSPLKYRSVMIYWKKIPEMYQNGAIRNYIVSSDGLKNHTFGARNLSGSVLVPCKGRHNISVTGCNSAGCSPHSSIIVRDNKELNPPDKLIVEQAGGDKMSLTWFGSSFASQSVSKIHVIWCKGEAAVQKCRGEINVLPKDTSLTGNHVLVSKKDINDSFGEIIFGVALLNGENLSSGIRWQETCRYTKDTVMPKPSDIRLLPLPPDDSLAVSWSRVKCDRTSAKNAYVKSYRIQYCRLNNHDHCKGNKAEVSLSADGMTRYTIHDLEDEKKYGIWVAAVSLRKNISYSDMIIGIPKNNDLTVRDISFIAAGSGFLFILAIFGLVCIIRQAIRKLGFQEEFPIQTIQIEDCKQINQENSRYIEPSEAEEYISFIQAEKSDRDVKDTPFSRQLSEDSGHSSISSTLRDSNFPLDDLLMKDQKLLLCVDHKQVVCQSEKVLDSGDELRSSSSDTLGYIPPVKEIMEYDKFFDEHEERMEKYNYRHGYMRNQEEELKCPKNLDYVTNSTTDVKDEHFSVISLTGNRDTEIHS
ncbi:interleukin-6 receptor subunit beta-like [Saccostrea echinata]|uniref:interleukin-6 receptor subunit beta-like n=1 Tax=Saccostrea echinata TaxID=191078 RepID=UPI002A814336|nr:interleukin-6 receptor subunit beta-like [Saccostrea echinata]